MDNNYQNEEEKKEKLIADIKRAYREKVNKLAAGMKYRVARNKKGKLVYIKNNNNPMPKRQPAGNKAVAANKISGNKAVNKNKPVNRQIIPVLQPVDNEEDEKVDNVVEAGANAKPQIPVVEIFMPPVFAMEKPEPIEQPAANEQENNEIAQGNNEIVQDNNVVIQGNDQEVQENNEIIQGNNQEVQENKEIIQENNQEVQENNEIIQENNQEVQENNEIIQENNQDNQINNENVQEVIEQLNDEAADNNIDVQENNQVINNNNEEAGQNNGEIQAVAEQIHNEVAAEVNAQMQENNVQLPPVVQEEVINLSMIGLNKALYYILNGVEKNVSMEEIEELSLANVGARMMLQKKAESNLKADELKYTENQRKKNSIKEAVRRLEELKKDEDGSKRIDEFLKLDYTVFDKFDDMYIVFSFDRINQAIEKAEYIEQEVMPLVNEKNTLSPEKHARALAMISAIKDYKNYMNLRMMIIADSNYTLAFDDELLKGAGDEDEISERFENYTADKNIDPRQLSIIMRYITYKTQIGDNPLFSMHYDPEPVTMLDRMKAYGWVEEDENNAQENEEEFDEDINIEADNLEAELGVQNAAANNAAIQNAGANNAAENVVENNGPEGEIQPEVIVNGNIAPEVPEILIPKRKKRLNYLLNGVNAVPEAEPALEVGNRADLAKEARDIYEQWESMNLEKEFEDTLSSMGDIINQGFVIPPEIIDMLSKSLKPGTSIKAREANKKALAAGMYKGGEDEAAMLPVVLADAFMNNDFSMFDSIEDEDIVKNYSDAVRLMDYGFALRDYIEQAIENETCLISKERTDNFYAILSALKDYTEYAIKKMDIIRSPFYSLIDINKSLEEQDVKEIRNRMPAEPGDEDESPLLEFVYNGIELAPYQEKVKNGSFFERAAGYGYKAVDDYKDNNLEVQAEYIREVARISRERLLFNSVQRVVGSGQDYDETRNNPAFNEKLRKRQELSERAEELFANLSDEPEPDMWVEELLNTDVSIFDGIGKDETFIENFNEIYKLTSRGLIIENKLEAHKNNEIELTTEQKQILSGIKNMLDDARLYITLKLNQIRNPYYKTMHTVDESANENLDRQAYDNNYSAFETDDAQLDIYVNMTNLLQNSEFFARISENGKEIKDRYISEAMSVEDNTINENLGANHMNMDNNYSAVAYLLDGEENMDNIDKATFKEGISRRIEKFGKANESYNKALSNNSKVQSALSVAYTRLDDLGYVNYEIDPAIINGIYPLIKTGETDEDVKYNMELLMNLGAPEKNTRGAAYKAMVDSFLGIDISRFDRCDDEYIMANFDYLKSVGVQAEIMANKELLDTFSKNGYKISAQKKANLMILAQAVKRYVSYMDSRMALMKHPLYIYVFRNADEGKQYDPEELKNRLAEAKGKADAREAGYIDVLFDAFTKCYPGELREKSMEERLLADDFVKLVPGEYDEDIEGKEEYQEEISEGKIIKESVDLRTEMIVSNVLKELATGDGSMSLEDYKKQTGGGEKRRELAQRVRELPDFDNVEPKIIMADLLTDDADILNEFLGMSFNELDNLSDEKLVENYTEIAALCGMENQIATTLTRLRESDEKPLASTVAAVEGRLNMLRDIREYIFAKLSVIRDPLYEKHYDSAYLGFDEKREDMEGKINEKGEQLGEQGRAYLRKVAIAKSSPFMSKYTGTGSTTADAYGKQQEEEFYKKAVMQGEGEDIAHHDEEGRVEGDMPLEPDEIPADEPPAQIEGALESESMAGPLKELVELCDMTKTYKQKIFKKQKNTYQVTDQKGKVKEVTRTERVLDKVEDKKVSKDINNQMEPIREQIKVIMDFLDLEFDYKDDKLFEMELGLLLNHIEVLDIICGQYMTGRRNMYQNTMEQDIVRKVRRIRKIAKYAYTQTYTSARMSRIYFRQQDFSGKRVPWKNIYYYAEQPIVWEQGLVPYDKVNAVDKEMRDVATGAKPPRTRLKTFTEKDNSHDKIEHWMKIFSECKPDEAVAIDREISIKDMERLEMLILTTNTRSNQGIPDDSVDFVRACEDMIHSYTATRIRIKKYMADMKLETDDDKTQKQMLEYVLASLDWQIQIYNAYKDKIADTYDVIKADSENRTISDVFRSWNNAYTEYAKRKLTEMSVADAAADGGKKPGNKDENP